MNADAAFHFPFETFRSATGFRQFLHSNRALLDQRYAYEAACAAAARDPVLISPGSCALCLRATSFSTQMSDCPGEAADRTAQANSVVEPNWREQQLCGCPDRLNCRFRALLHYIEAEIDPPPWTRLLLLGAAQSIESRLQCMAAQVAVRARSGRLLRAPRFEPQAYHMILSCEHLHAEQAIDAVFAGLRDALMPGGHLVFTAPFDTASDVTISPPQGRAGVLGWDILPRLARAGFSAAAAHLFWSEEFGYLGPFNLIFSAAA